MNKMEKVIVKIELDRDDVSAMMRLAGSKLTDEQWDKMKGQECTLNDEDSQRGNGAGYPPIQTKGKAHGGLAGYGKAARSELPEACG